jgi:hypothetical protein
MNITRLAYMLQFLSFLMLLLLKNARKRENREDQTIIAAAAVAVGVDLIVPIRPIRNKQDPGVRNSGVFH